MKRFVSVFIFLLLDTVMIWFSITLAYYLREGMDWLEPHTISCSTYLHFYPLYLILLILFAYEGIYTRRYDFWHETRLILKTIVFASILIFAYLAMTKSIEHYSRLVIGLSFVIAAFLLPISKNIAKKILFRAGIWRKSAEIYGNDPFLHDEIYGNPYLGYVKPQTDEEPSTVFINSRGLSPSKLQTLIDTQLKNRHEVVFIPFINDFDLTHSDIYELANTRTNLIVFQNRLKSHMRIATKRISDFTLSIVLIPLLLPLVVLIAYRIKRDEPNGRIFFKQKRLGINGKLFSCYKFRTMYEHGDDILESYLETHPEERDHYAKFHKYRNDPRITPIGRFLRRTSLDELPQIFNVLRGDMSLIGPRPYLPEEAKQLGNYRDTILMVKPGITGLWQVSGRSDTDFLSRIDIDVWYVRNWSLWLDVVILIKTFKVLLKQEGAY